MRPRSPFAQIGDAFGEMDASYGLSLALLALMMFRTWSWSTNTLLDLSQEIGTPWGTIRGI